MMYPSTFLVSNNESTTKPVKQVKSTMDETCVKDDYERAEQDIFSVINHAEKAVEDIVRDEVNVLFGHRSNGLSFGRRGSGSSHDHKKEMKNTSSSSSGDDACRSSKPSKETKDKNEQQERGGAFMDFMDSYTDTYE